MVNIIRNVLSFSWLKKDRNRKDTAKHSIAIRYISLFVTIIIGFIMVPMYIKYIPGNIYGFWLASGYFLVLLVSFDPGLTIVLQQRVAHHYGKNEIEKVNDYISGGLIISGVVSFIAILLGFIFKQYIPSLIGITSEFDIQIINRSLTYAILGTALSFFSFSISAINQGLQSSLGVGIIVLSVNALSSLISAILLIKGYGVESISISMLLGGTLLIIFQASYLFIRIKVEKIRFKFSIRNISDIIKILSFTFLGRSASIVASNLDLIIVCKFISPSSLVVLTISRKAFDYAKELINQIVVGLTPSLSHLSSSNDNEHKKSIIIRLTKILFWIFIFVTGGLLCFNREFVALWVSSSQFIGETSNVFLIISFFLITIISFLHNIGTSFGNFKLNSIASFIQAVLLIVSLFFGSKYFGIYGAILAPAFSIIIGPIFIYLNGFNSIFKLSIENKLNLLKEFGLSLFVLIVSCCLFFELKVSSWVGFITNIIFYALVFIILTLVVSKSMRKEYLKIKEVFFNKISLMRQ